MFFLRRQKNNKRGLRCSTNIKSGFTLIELLVVTTIFVIITSVILANHSKFSSSAILENVAYDIALTIRQAQTYGMSVKEFGVGTGNFPAYGAFFSTANAGKEFYLFADTEGANDKIYNNGSSCTPEVTPECLDKFLLQNSYRIYAVCGDLKKDNQFPNPARTTDDFSGVLSHCNYGLVNVAFTRPDPMADINSVVLSAKVPLSDTEIVVASPRGDVRTVVVWKSGQISIE